MADSYQNKLRSLLSPEERRVFQKLSTPRKVQDYLDTLEINFEESGETQMSPRRVLRHKKAHCIEGAIFAAAALAYHGQPPLLLDLQTPPKDDDHVVALFKEDGLWGAISKTNHMILRWRDPVYATVRELAMSFFHEYYMTDGSKTLRRYSRPFNLRRYKLAQWVLAEDDLDWLAIDLDDSPHFPVAPKKVLRRLRPASRLERKAVDMVEWAPNKRHRS